MNPISRTCCFLLLVMSSATPLMADEIHIAVASNFAATLSKLANIFEKNSTHKVVLITGSTGKHYAQIIHGAPFDAFFAADAKRPQRLEREGIMIPGSRFTYAWGKIILWSPLAGLVTANADVLTTQSFNHLAIGSPKLAPYGRAAKEVLQKLKLWQPLQKKIVRGENIGQAFQFVKSGNAELGFVALAQVQQADQKIAGSWWHIPETLYSPIQQQAVLLKDNNTAREFLAFVQSPQAQQLIRNSGYAIK